MRRVRNVLLACLIAGMTAAPLLADPKPGKPDLSVSNWAIGIFLGEPTGVTAQLDLSETQALEFKTAWNFVSTKQQTSDSGSVTLQANYILWFPGVFVLGEYDFPPFVGAGAEIRISSDLPLIGLRIPFGVRYRFRKAPLEMALELGAGMSLFPSTDFMPSGGLAVRWML